MACGPCSPDPGSQASDDPETAPLELMSDFRPQDTAVDAPAPPTGAGESADPPSCPEPVELPQTRYDLRILQSIRRIMRSAGLYSHKLAAMHGVTVPQLVCLMKIEETAPVTIKTLSKEVFLSPSTLVGIVDRLESKTLVERRRSTEDRRQVLLSATENGRELIARSPSPLHESLSDSVTRLSEGERADLAGALERIVDLMEIGELDASPILEPETLLESQEDDLAEIPSA